jgi:hypothetical protein
VRASAVALRTTVLVLLSFVSFFVAMLRSFVAALRFFLFFPDFFISPLCSDGQSIGGSVQNDAPKPRNVQVYARYPHLQVFFLLN